LADVREDRNPSRGFAGAYVLLVFVAQTWWQGLLLAILLGHPRRDRLQHPARWRPSGLFELPFSQHAHGDDAGTDRGSSYLWRWKHVVLHHTYVNITGHDTDVDLGILARLTPHQERLAFHRWQHLYLWPLYGLLAIKWQLLDDFRKLIRGRISTALPSPEGVGARDPCRRQGDLLHRGLRDSFAVPLRRGRPLYYGVAGLVTGTLLSVVFQVPTVWKRRSFHCHAGYRAYRPRLGHHQAETTVDFARRSHVVTWLVGGLNFQIEHHLFPRVSHVNYPAISTLVEETCRDFGIRYAQHESFRQV